MLKKVNCLISKYNFKILCRATAQNTLSKKVVQSRCCSYSQLPLLSASPKIEQNKIRQ